MSREMIARVAAAIRNAQARPHTEEDVARAAIEAMRKPNSKMLSAASKALSPGRRPTDEWISVSAKHGLRYRAMIDAALPPIGGQAGRNQP